MSRELDRPVQHRFIRLMGIIARIALGALFIFAGTTKAYDPGEFAVEIQKYNLIPWILGVVVALYLPWVEILTGLVLFLEGIFIGLVLLLPWFGTLTGLVLLFKKLEKGALLLVTVMLMFFTAALASAMVRGLSIDCGCFGKAITATGTTIPLIRNVILLGLTAFIWRDNT